MNNIPAIDNGFMLLKEDQDIKSRIAVIHYELYDHPSSVIQQLVNNSLKIQCIVTNLTFPIKTISPGEAQNPSLWDYADDVDTLNFLLS